MLTLFLLSILTIIILTIIIQRFQSKCTRLLNKIPGPATYPLIGNLPNVVGTSEKLWHYFRSLGRDFYPIYRLWNGHIGSVGLLHPDDIEILLTSKKHLRKSKIYEWLQPWLGTGLLTSAGDKWHSRRKILTPAFHFNILQEFVEIFTEQSQLLVERLQEECNKSYTDIVPVITQFTLHSICETAMGTRLDETKKQTKEYVKAIYRMGEILVYRITRPWLFFNKIFYVMPESKEQQKLLGILHNFSMSVIEERKTYFKETNLLKDLENYSFKSDKRLAMLDLLISAKNKGVPITDEGIREEVDTFMFEGHDTTTASICFTLMLLANHPNIQEKVVGELLKELGDANRPITFQDLPKLRYLEQVIKESLRLYPSVPVIARRTDEEIYTATGYVIPANVYCHVQIFDLHHNPKLYPDPYKFDPERFSLENTRTRHPFAYIPFSAGPRNCIGQKFAILELKTVLASVLRRFVLEPVDGPKDMKMIVHLVLKTQHGIRLKFKER
ncbi:hypothetical protein ILUMI_07412 [Ignelater luminosus]|uniref:Cytochrome P450 n=1 Tax=Ignelater luminosus TaxID=2038154 RepID=A0A8K0D9E6_IGNLU|nr:hypothetical protein ILUMI_07412 [Ignelater luminosus]